MKTMRIVAAVAVGLLTGCDELPTARLDPGGVTFDFQALSDAKFSIPKPGDPGNFVSPGPWTGGEYCQIHHAKVKYDRELFNKMKEGVRWHQQDGVCHVEKLPILEKLAGLIDGKPLAEQVSGAFTKIVELPDDKGGTYRLSFRYKARHSLGQHSYYLMYYKKKDPKSGRWVAARAPDKTTYCGYPMKDDWSGWNIFSRDVVLPPGVGAVDLILRIDGVGDLMFKDVGLVRSKRETQEASLILSPQEAFGNGFVLSQNQPAGIGFSIRKNGDAKYNLYDCRFRLTLPAGVEFLGSSFGNVETVKKEIRPDGSTVVSFGPSRTNWFQYNKEFTTWNRLLALVRTAQAPGWKGAAQLEFLSPEGKPLAKKLDVALSVIETIRAEKPKRYMNGISTAGKSTYFQDEKADDVFAQFMGACGVDWIICCEHTDAMVASWRQAGVRVITPTPTLANGYYLTRDWRNLPKEDRFVRNHDTTCFGTRFEEYLDRSVCPFAVIEERPFFRTNIVVREIIEPSKGCDGLWSNWEPFMYKGRGCDCATCKAEFAKWHAKTGGSVGDFRSMVHGKMVRVLDKYVRAATGGEKSLGFIPGVSWREMTSAWRESDPSPESRPIDYAADFQWIDPWGPYVIWDAETPYLYQKRGPLAHFIAAKDVREQTDRDFKPGARPKLMSFPHGVQGLSWVTQPEHLEMALDSFFFNRWEASVLYFFPQGLDARFWKAFAQATTRAAKCEAHVLDGRVATEDCELKPVAEYALPSGYVTTYLPKYKDVPMLQHVAYDLDGSRLVAAFNFWDKGEAFFTLRLKNLRDGDYVITDENGVVYPKGKLFGSWSAADLQRGVKLMVGAARTVAFFVTPKAAAPKSVASLTAEQMETLYQTRRAALAAAAEEDAKYEKSNSVTVNTKAEL